MEFSMHPIGVIHTPFKVTEGMPIQSARSTAAGKAVIDPQYNAGLQDLEGFSHIYLIYILHCSTGFELKVKPFLDDSLHGLFATRHPCRPNPIGLSIVRLLERRDNILEFEGADMLDGTPLLDIKPYVPEFDAISDAMTGWYQLRSKP
jgi:tRNA-Thr(GGU) m(6)t(6)A37 methyltransferase TsaA